MLYKELLAHGHWESFADYLWQHTDCGKRSGMPAPAWRHLAKGQEEDKLLLLFEGEEEYLYEQLEQYFDRLGRQQTEGHCFRCNKSFRGRHTAICQLCGWAFVQSNEYEPGAAEIEINELLNAQYVMKQISVLKMTAHFNRLDREAKHWSAACNQMMDTEAAMKKELAEKRNAIEADKHRKEHLEDTLKAQIEDIKQLELMQKNAEALFYPFDDRPTDQIVTLTFRGHILHAKALPPTKFPTELVMGVQKTSDGPPVKTINKTCAFVFIREEQWISVGNYEWKVDLSEIARGKIVGDFYINYFSGLHKKDNRINIRYDIKQLRFI